MITINYVMCRIGSKRDSYVEGTSNHETDINYDPIREKCLLLAQTLRRIEEEGERQLP